MDIVNNEEKTAPRRKKYTALGKRAITAKQRRVAVAALSAESASDAVRRSGVSENNIHVLTNQEAVKGPSMSKLLSQSAVLAEIESFCRDIIARDHETPLKASDRIAAARLLADIRGTTNKHTTVDVNVGVLDLRQASDEELAAELDRLEKTTNKVIDVSSNSVQDSTLS